MLSYIFLLAGLAAADSLPEQATATSARRVDPPVIVVHRQPSVPLISLRLSILANDPPGYAGAGHMIQHLIYPSLQDQVARVGGRAQIQRTADAIVYSVMGPVHELSYLSGVLLSALESPDPPADAVLRVDRELREERLAEWETAPAHARSVLRAQLFPADISAAGTDRSATRFTRSNVAALWSHMYRPERISLLAVGDVFLADVQREFANLPEARSPRLVEQRDSIVLGALAPAQATRAWLGSAYLASDLDPAAVSVAARLIGDAVRERLPTAQVDTEHWWTHHGQALAIIVAIQEPGLALARRTVGAAVGTALDGLDFLSVVDAATAIRREMLFYSRTPDRMAELIGQFVDRDADPNAAEKFYAQLDALDDEDVREVLDRLLERTPARVEIPPQTLMQRPR